MKNDVAVLFGVVAAGESTKHWNGGRYGYWMLNCPDVDLPQGDLIVDATEAFIKKEAK